MARRSDVHSPSNLVTEDYEFVACGNYATVDVDAYSPLATSHKHLIDEGWRFASTDQESGGGCQHCGAFIIYYAILKHIPSHSLLKVGETCLDNRFALASDEFHKLRKHAKLNRERVRLSAKRDEWLATGDNQVAYDFAKARCEAGDYGFISDDGSGEGFYERFWRYVKRYGEASEKYVGAILRSQVREAEWAAKREAEAASASPVEVGKQTIVGEVVSAKWKNTQYGESLKIIVRDDRGFKVWGSAAAALTEIPVEVPAGTDLLPYRDVQKGDRVRFDATVAASDDDPTFGFFKRPTKASIINSEELSHAV